MTTIPQTKAVEPLPNEIWVRVASFLSDREIRRIAGVNRVFYGLAFQGKQRELVLPICLPPSKEQTAIEREIRVRLDSPKNPLGVRTFKFLSTEAPTTRRKVVSVLGTPIRKAKSFFSSSSTIFSPFERADTCHFVFKGAQLDGPVNLDQPRLPAIIELWEFIGPRLVELSIQLEHGVQPLATILPPLEAAGTITPLPHLQRMKLEIKVKSDHYFPPNNKVQLLKIVDVLVQLYSNERLSKLEIMDWTKIPELIAHLLPSPATHTFPHLTRFSLYPSATTDSSGFETQVSTFITAHLGSLQRLDLDNMSASTLSHILTPTMLAKEADKSSTHIYVSLSGLGDTYARDREIDELRRLGHALPNLRRLLYSFQDWSPHDLSDRELLDLLPKLKEAFNGIGHLDFHIQSLNPQLLANIARAMPSLNSVRLQYRSLDSYTDAWKGKMEALSLDDKLALKAWKLGDLSLADANGRKDHKLAVTIAGFVPAVDAFWGHDDMLPEMK